MAANGARQVVIARVAGTACGIDIEAVLEILPPTDTTPIPGAPSQVLGVLNLRGGVVPVAELRSVLGFPAAPFDQETRFVFVSYGQNRIGLVVDEVVEVITVDPSACQRVGGDFARNPGLRSVIRNGDELVLDIDHEVALDACLGDHDAWAPWGNGTVQAAARKKASSAA